MMATFALGGSASRSCENASRPPADAPTPTIVGTSGPGPPCSARSTTADTSATGGDGGAACARAAREGCPADFLPCLGWPGRLLAVRFFLVIAALPSPARFDRGGGPIRVGG